jgi:hypothetical protein
MGMTLAQVIEVMGARPNSEREVYENHRGLELWPIDYQPRLNTFAELLAAVEKSGRTLHSNLPELWSDNRSMITVVFECGRVTDKSYFAWITPLEAQIRRWLEWLRGLVGL